MTNTGVPGESKHRYDWVDVAKAVSILLVVATHTSIELRFIGIATEWSNTIVEVFATMRMPLFFAASGLFATKWLTAKWRELLSRKLALLIWVFLIWQPIVLAYKVAEMLWLPNQPENSVAEQVAKFALSPFRPNGELWFLWALCVFLVLARLTSKLPIWVRVGVPAVVSALWISLHDLLPASIDRLLGAGWNGALSYYVFFVAAATFSATALRYFSSMSLMVAAAWIIPWAATSYLLWGLDANIFGLRFFVILLALPAGFGLARLLASIKPMRTLGRHTLPVYVAHIVFVVAITIAIYQSGLAPFAASAPSVTFVVVWAVSAGLSLLVYYLIRGTRIGRYAYEQPAWFLASRISAGSK